MPESAKLRLGIYLGSTNPGLGGAHTLIETIRSDIECSRCAHERIVFFEDKNSKREITREGIRYLNLAVRPRQSLASRARRKASRLLGRSATKSRFRALLEAEKIDLLWIVGPFSLDTSVPYIFTVWDLGHRITPFFPEVNTDGWTWEERESTYKKMLFKASYVITGNNEGKREILENYPMDPQKIRAVPFPVPDACYKPIDLPDLHQEISEPFIFYPAQFWAHKNHVVLLKALDYLRAEKQLEINCYFVGSDKGNQTYIQRSINEYQLGDRVKVLGFVDDATLRYLYKKALALTFVSLLGPNNLPPLEAAALGCPVILSDIPGHREQMGDAALYVNATSCQSVGNAIITLLTETKLRDALINRGNALVEQLKERSYFAEILKIVEEFAAVRDCWGS